MELAETLRELGLRKPEAYLATYLHLAGPSVSSAVEVGTSLRQPEVSMAAKELEEQGHLERRVADDEGDHRPRKEMRLTDGLEAIIAELKEEAEERYREEMEKIERAEELSER